MNNAWQKRWRSAGWLSLAAIGLVLLVAGVTKKDHKKCADVKVEVTGVNRHIFIDEKEVLKLLNATGQLKDQPIEDINLQLLERRLENDKWIKNAELFFDNNEVLQVKVEEREPIARIFTVMGNSYYIDSTGSQLPLSDKISVRVPMFTNFPAEGKRLRSRDSIMMETIKDLATYITADSFWNAQVAQIDITPNRTFEMVPTIGNHTVLLGKARDIDKEFQRLYSFYKEVWTKVGLDRYSIIDVQYKGQVVATRKGTGYASVDSVKAKEAFFKLVNSNKPDTIDEAVAKIKPIAAKEVKAKPEAPKKEPAKVTSLTGKVKEEIAKVKEKDKEKQKKDVEALKPKEEVKKTTTVKEEESKKPKAVMTKKKTASLH